MLTQSQQDILKGYGNRIVQSLKEKLTDKKINASGDLSTSIRFEVDEAGLRIYAADYVYFVNYGRKPGKMPPRDSIMDWIDDKHLTYDIPKDSLAFLIQRKIGKEGTEATNFIEEVITDELVGEIQNAFAEDIFRQVQTMVLEAYQIAA